MKELFEQIFQWQQETFPTATPLTKLLHMQKELEKELIPAIQAGECSDKEEVAKEFADCFLLLFGSAHAYGFSFDQIIQLIQNKFQINKNRQWGKPNSKGFTEHIKEPNPDDLYLPEEEGDELFNDKK